MRALITLSLLTLANTASAATFEDFDGPYALSNWTTSGILDGTAYVDLAASSTTSAEFVYDVDLGYPAGGVSYRLAEFEVYATVDGTVAFDWDFAWDHRIHKPEAELIAWAEDDTGAIQTQQLHYEFKDSFGPDSAAGSLTGLQVYAGRPFGVAFGGSNLDADSRISGTLVLTSFELDATDVDCAGIPGGPNEEDFCGTCDANPYNDCVQDCNGVFGGDATLDACNVCDNDPTNDCGPDCNGDYGGGAQLDMCDVCDTDPTNDCEQDCNGEWGGDALTDNCNVCDDDPTNDCVQDCAGAWGGDAFLDDCGVCVGGSTGRDPCEPDTGATADTGTPGSTPGTTDTATGSTPGTGSTTTPGTGNTTTPTEGEPTTYDTGRPEVVEYQRVGGCGCQSSSPTGWLALGLIAVPFLRRR